MTPELTIVIPVHNNISGCLELISDFHRLHDVNMFRLIVVDQTKEGIIFEKDKPAHLHIRTYRPLGFSKSINIGWKLSQTPYTLLANDDVRLLSASWYEEAKAHLKDGVLGVNPYPALRTWDGGGVPRWYHEIHGDWWQWTKDKPFESYTEEDYKRLQEKLKGGDPPGTTYFFTLLRTETREIVGLIDESMAINASDYDHNRRIYLTCKNCNKRKYEHQEWHGKPQCGIDYSKVFEPYKILTCTHSLVHHHCGITKAKMATEEKMDGYQLIAQSKGLFNEKWKSDDCPNPDIYGKTGSPNPTGSWWTEIPL